MEPIHRRLISFLFAVCLRKRTHGQEVDGRAKDRQLQRADRQAREQATIQHLLACSVGMISDDGARGWCKGAAARCDPAPSPATRRHRPAELMQCHGSPARHQPCDEGQSSDGLVVPAAIPRRLIPGPGGEVVLELRDFLPHALQLLVCNGDPLRLEQEAGHRVGR